MCLLSLLTHKTELIVREVYGAGKTQCIALLAAFFALRGHQVYCAARENTSIAAMASFVQQLLPRAPDNEWHVAIRLLSSTSASDARDTDRNPNVWHAKLVLATTGLRLAQFRHKCRPLANAVDYAELFIHDEAQQEAALSDLAILGSLPRKCFFLRFGDPKQTSGGTGPSDLARKVRLVSDQLALGIRSNRRPYLPQALPALLLDDLPLNRGLASCENPLAADEESANATGGPPPLVAILRLTHPCLLMRLVRLLHLLHFMLLGSCRYVGTLLEISTHVLANEPRMTGVSCCLCLNGCSLVSTP